MVNDQNVHQMLDAIEIIIKQYSQNGFRVRSVSGKDIFSPLKDWLTKRHIKIETYNPCAHIMELG